MRVFLLYGAFGHWIALALSYTSLNPGARVINVRSSP